MKFNINSILSLQQMEYSAKQIADYLDGEVYGNPDVLVSRPGKIEAAQRGEITFLANPKYTDFIYTTEASIVLVNKEFEPKQELQPTLIFVKDVYHALSVLLSMYEQSQKTPRTISKLAHINPDSVIADDVNIGEFSVVSSKAMIGKGTHIYSQVFIGENVSIGKNCIIYPGVKIYKDCKIGNFCILHANAVIGSDGFGFAPNAQGEMIKISQVGNVILEDNVEIGANTVVDRATMGSTIIESGVKLDNLIQIGHNVVVGKNTVVAAQSGIAGSSKIGEQCLIGGQVGIAGHLSIANKTMIQAKSGINANIGEEGKKWYGYPAIDYSSYLRSYALFKKLPELWSKILKLEEGSDSKT